MMYDEASLDGSKPTKTRYSALDTRFQHDMFRSGLSIVARSSGASRTEFKELDSLDPRQRSLPIALTVTAPMS